MLPFTPDDLMLAVLEGRVTRRKHPTLPLYIYNYSAEVQFLNHWDDITLNCRGLILDEDFNVVARPWKKFFNMGQRDNEIHSLAPVEVTDKLDGSLGILYPDGSGGYAIATRGSFDSKQAREATKIWNEKYSQLNGAVHSAYNKTFLFEIIYPANRIVVNYGDMRDLVILGSVDNEYGYYMGPNEAAGMITWNGPVAEVFPFDTFVDALANWPHREGKEGVVIRSGNKMVKLKQADYLELHKLVTNASPKTVWQQLANGKSRGEILAAFPDEFYDYIDGFIIPLTEQFERRMNEILIGYSDAMYEVSKGTWGYDNPDQPTRAMYAAEFKKHDDARYYFLLLDNKPVRHVLWQELKPREEGKDGLRSPEH